MGQNNMIFKLLQQKWCRIIYEFRQNTIFGSEMCEIGPEFVIWSCPDLSRRTSTYCKPAEISLFFQELHLSFFINKLIISYKSCVLLSKFIMFYKIICFIKQIYHFYKIICVLFSKFIIFYRNIYHFYKIICFTTQNYDFI